MNEAAYMTREHNDARLITLGTNIVGQELALAIANAFLNAPYREAVDIRYE